MSLWYHKVDSLHWLDGSIREDLIPDERSVWADILALGGLTREPRRGYIERSEGIPYPKTTLLSRLNISEELFDRTVAKCIKEGRLQVYPDGTMLITNWLKYNDTTDFRERKKKREIAVEKTKATNRRKDAVLDRIYQLVNRLNAVDKQYQYEVRGDRIVDKATGEVKDIDEIERKFNENSD